jgi:arylsulfatase A-like enzyme
MSLSPGKLVPISIGLVMVIVACDSREPGGSSSSAARPNVLVIITDDQRVGTLGTMDATRRWMARGGTGYRNAFVTTPLCCPSRVSIMTGRFAHNHGVKTNPAGNRLNERTTLQRYLQESGYRTGLFGKFLSGWELSHDPAFLDEWGIMHNRSRYYGARWNVNGTLKRVARYSVDYLTAEARAFLRRADEEDDGRPWYLYLAPAAVHAPRIPEPAYEDMAIPPFAPTPATAERNRGDKPPYVRQSSFDLDTVRRVRAGQIRTLASVDDMVSALFDELRISGELENTLIFYTSDNGYLWGEHGMPTNFMAKSNPYEFSVRVPLLVRWPGRFEPGRTDERFVTNVDIAPTVLDAAEVDTGRSNPMDGRSLLRDWSREVVVTEYWTSNESPIPPWAAMWTTSFHYVEYYGPGGRPIFREYYDLATDPAELHNLVADEDAGNDPDLDRLSRQLRHYRRCAATACP